MRALGVAILLISSFFGSAGSACAESPIRFLVQWAGPNPGSVFVDDGGSGLELTLDQPKSVFHGDLDPALSSQTDLFRYMRLIASYATDAQETLPLRIGGNMTIVKIRLFRAASLTCDEATVQEVEHNTMDPDLAMKRFALARDLSSLEGPNRCGPFMQKRVAKAWFDRSYALTQIRDYCRLDDDAVDAYKRIDKKYVDNYVNEVKAHEIKLANDQKKALAGAGNFEAAANLNASIVTAVSQDPKIAKMFEAKQRLPLAQLTVDGQDLRQRASQSD